MPSSPETVRGSLRVIPNGGGRQLQAPCNHEHDTSSKTLTRSSTDRKVGGVSGGLAAYFGLDPVLFRVGFVVSTLFTGGAPVLAYLGILAFVPRRRRRDLSRGRLNDP